MQNQYINEWEYNRIKGPQRCRYFTRNRRYYKDGILLECNRHRIQI